MVASCALKHHLRNISLVLLLSEIDVALQAAHLATFYALNDVILYQHAERTLEVWRDLIQFIAFIEVIDRERAQLIHVF